MILTIDLTWLLEIAHRKIPGDPEVWDWGSLEAARARHGFQVMDTLVYDQPHHRAASLLQQLVRIPALEHSNELYAATVAAAYLQGSGLPVNVTTKEVGDLLEQVSGGLVDVRQIAVVLKEWTR
ncbi:MULTISPECIES: fic family toxin-antitoxin system, toxin component [unclassified Streptomyces]|uniref:fic family toxin-antitoxin system, toxin component n=1 Tax=unclassified Streptomyces TaxID=2593676 RepID=UPI000DC7D490|nr:MULTISPECIES: fic family toxin-antitoxin system, toxin component [unclassified Streptomyces]AWZ07874.1 fic family toxin-antitoxin system, toxin component [Streptomyces sp. ICC4]AWZ15527.1 fic family toxin-antitoxin system, toxin component [Streptomyces sp. ICC1]